MSGVIGPGVWCYRARCLVSGVIGPGVWCYRARCYRARCLVLQAQRWDWLV